MEKLRGRNCPQKISQQISPELKVQIEMAPETQHDVKKPRQTGFQNFSKNKNLKVSRGAGIQSSIRWKINMASDFSEETPERC